LRARKPAIESEPPSLFTFGSLPSYSATACTVRWLFEAKRRFLPTLQA
jgi:hypothetical protein